MDEGIEMSSRAEQDPEQGSDKLPPLTEPSSVLRPRLRSQNRWFALVLTLFGIGAAVYFVGGLYSNEEGTLIHKYDAHSGVITNDFDNNQEVEHANEQTNLHKTINVKDTSGHQGTSGQATNPTTANSFWENHGKENPFGNDNVPHSVLNQTAFQQEHKQKAHAAAEARWNRTHPGQPFPGHGSISGNNNFKGGHNSNGHNQGGTTTGTIGAGHGGAGGKGGGLNGAGSPQGNGSGQGNEMGNGHSNGNGMAGPTAVVKDQCEANILKVHSDWLNTAVTLRDGERYEVLEKLDHDKDAFTQGLTYANNQLYESTGLYGESTVRILDPDTADVIKTIEMEDHLFGEGMAYLDDTLIQITWKKRKGFVYNAADLEVLRTFTYATTRNEGWGITVDDCRHELIVTDGSDWLHFWDPVSLQQKRRVKVERQSGKPARSLNEIEFWRGRVLANVWHEDVLLVINPSNGVVEKEYDFSTLWPKHERDGAGADVFNGISVSADEDILYVTGKKWNRMYKIRLF